MTITLIHIAPGHGPVGVWRIPDHGPPTAHYPNDPHHTHHNRAAATLAAKGDNVPWTTWARRLANRIPYLDDYRLITTTDTEPLPDILTRATTTWPNTP